MSELKKKTENGSVDGAEDATSNEQKAGGDSGVGMGVLFFIAAFAVCFLSGWLLFPSLLYSKKEQPFNFNHALHVEQTSGCESCHYFREDGSFAGVPKNSSCMECHESQLGDTKDEEIFMTEYVEKGIEVPWYIYSKQPDCVFFSHSAHVVGAKMDCVTCHGHIGESESLKPYQENRITGYSRDIWGESIWGIKKNPWDRMKMDDCAQCHQEETGSKGACFQCHK
ncbi:MAG: cytochrome c3 family protein [Desulfamplus sp.]|nr:cytochrome c3 family protein [Desulfamplus sp.]MBF0240964.1 cytochrome c3 family protein [Desulfamplus sp.]MBF0390697.1 cytochrome c3 family protein [Desulfamplus sp.]